MPPTNIKDQLLRDEALRLKPYLDSVGKLTIGIGRNLEDKGITRSEAEFMLNNDIREVTTELKIHLPWIFQVLDSIRLAVIINMTFNMGINRLLRFVKMLDAVEHGDFSEASRQMLDSKWATQVGDRAKRLAKQMETGVWH